MALNRLIVTILTFALFVPNTLAVWRAQEVADPQIKALAGETNDGGHSAQMLLDNNGHLQLRFSLREGFETFSSSNCPTFQIDDRKPLHHFTVGNGCEISERLASYDLGALENKSIHSLITHRIMNGNELRFRYSTSNGQYRETRFSLSASKSAFKKALGFGIEITVD